jgi:3-phosphoinositide dependent protein kinase-1
MQSLISRLGSLSTQCAQYYGAQIVDALEYTHSAGVIHRSVGVIHALLSYHEPVIRDLKPENLLLDDAFRIKIADFGTAKCLEPGGRF